MTRVVIWAALVGGLAGCGGATAGGGPSTAVAGQPPLELLTISEHVFQLHAPSNGGSDYYSTLVLTEEGAVVIDPTSERVAARWVEELQARGASLQTIVYSHWHLDHTTGAKTLRATFGDDVPVVAHERALQRRERWNREHPGKQILLPSETKGDDGHVIEVGGVRIELSYMGFAHSDNLYVATVMPDRVAYACDFVQNRGVGYADLPGVDIEEQIAQVQRLAGLDVDKVIFCHTAPGNLESVREFLGYFETMWDQVDAAIERGLTEDQVAAEVTLDAYRGWDRNGWLQQNVRGMDRWLRDHPDMQRPTAPDTAPTR